LIANNESKKLDDLALNGASTQRQPILGQNGIGVSASSGIVKLGKGGASAIACKHGEIDCVASSIGTSNKGRVAA
jgi:hypothetical protein